MVAELARASEVIGKEVEAKILGHLLLPLHSGPDQVAVSTRMVRGERGGDAA